MALETEKQIKEAVERSRQILIIFNPQDKGDAATASLALGEICKKLNKNVEIVGGGFQASSAFNFLPLFKTIRSELSPLQKFVIKIDLTKNKLASLSYDVKDDLLYIFITPKSGTITHEAIKTASSDFKFDLVMVVGAPDWQALGDVYHNNTELFSRVPMINIDWNPANEHFGKINLVDISSLASSEIVFELAQKIWPDLLDENIATLLLTGLIINTQSFRSPQINARTLKNAGLLVEKGARREEITQNLYRRRTLPTLKLWGRALANLKHDAGPGLVWASLSQKDFLECGATPADLSEIIDELIANSPEAKIIILLFETKERIEGIVRTQPSLNALELTKPFEPQGTKERAKIILKEKDLVWAEKEVVENVRGILTKE
ncbi:MAG: hypothetical protein HY982_02665 [Candidatus Magasanikbacteria bacterium]|nr:hypothetical protein [Candidatus Magasanikbacteria bacterium]